MIEANHSFSESETVSSQEYGNVSSNKRLSAKGLQEASKCSYAAGLHRSQGRQSMSEMLTRESPKRRSGSECCPIHPALSSEGLVKVTSGRKSKVTLVK